MGKHSSTAINSLIHVAQGRVLQRTAPTGVRSAPAPIPTLARPADAPPPTVSVSATAPVGRFEMPGWDADPDDEQTRRVDPEARRRMLASAAATYAPAHQPSPGQALHAGMYASYPSPVAPRVSLAQRLSAFLERYMIALGAVAVVLAVAITYAALGTHAPAVAGKASGASVAITSRPAARPAARSTIILPHGDVTAEPIDTTKPAAAPIAPTVAPILEPTVPTVAVAETEDAETEIEMPAERAKSEKKSRRTHRSSREKKLAARTVEPRAPRASRAVETDPVLAEIHREVKSTKGATGNGKVAIQSNVAAMIYIDGRKVSDSAPATLSVAPGKHQITLLDPATKKAKTSDVQIEAGKTVAVNRSF